MSTVAVPERVVEIDEMKSREPLWSVKSRVSWGALLSAQSSLWSVIQCRALGSCHRGKPER